MRRARRVGLGVLRCARPRRVSDSLMSPRMGRQNRGDPCGPSGSLRVASNPRRTSSRWGNLLRQHGGQGDEIAGHPGDFSPQVPRRHGRLGPRVPGRGQRLEPRVHGHEAQPGLARRHERRPDGRRLPGPLHRGGLVLAAGRGRVDDGVDGEPVRGRCVGHGVGGAVPAGRAAGALGSRQPVRRRARPARTREARHPVPHEPSRDLLSATRPWSRSSPA